MYFTLDTKSALLQYIKHHKIDNERLHVMFVALNTRQAKFVSGKVADMYRKSPFYGLQLHGVSIVSCMGC